MSKKNLTVGMLIGRFAIDHPNSSVNLWQEPGEGRDRYKWVATCDGVAGEGRTLKQALMSLRDEIYPAEPASRQEGERP